MPFFGQNETVVNTNLTGNQQFSSMSTLQVYPKILAQHRVIGKIES